MDDLFSFSTPVNCIYPPVVMFYSSPGPENPELVLVSLVACWVVVSLLCWYPGDAGLGLNRVHVLVPMSLCHDRRVACVTSDASACVPWTASHGPPRFDTAKAEQAQQHPGTKTTINPAENCKRKCERNAIKPTDKTLCVLCVSMSRHALFMHGFHHLSPTHQYQPQDVRCSSSHPLTPHRRCTALPASTAAHQLLPVPGSVSVNVNVNVNNLLALLV